MCPNCFAAVILSTVLTMLFFMGGAESVARSKLFCYCYFVHCFDNVIFHGQR